MAKQRLTHKEKFDEMFGSERTNASPNTAKAKAGKQHDNNMSDKLIAAEKAPGDKIIVPKNVPIDYEQYISKFQNLSKTVQKRVLALRKLQLDATQIEADFFVEIHKMECRYHQMYSKLYEMREKIVSGEYEPTDEDCVPSDEKYKTFLSTEAYGNEIVAQLLSEEDDQKISEDVKGIPNFWLTIFKNVALLNDMLQHHDIPILRHLQDIKVVFLESDPMGFILEFYFSPNEYFTNSVLTKRYEMKCAPSPLDPFSFEGPEIYTCKGCTIDWKKGKNVTMKTIKKRQKHKSRGAVRTVTKTVQNDSFFNFFSPPPVSEDSDAEIDEDTKTLLTSDFEIGHYIRERIVPHAVLFITGEALEDEEEYEDDEESEEDLTTDSEDVPPENFYNNPTAKNQNNVECAQQ